MKKRYLLLAAMTLFSFVEVSAQQNPQYTQYMYNMSVVNPAYAGMSEALSMGALYRKQWAGFEGAPATGTLFGHKRVGKNVGLGVSFINDKIGPVTENNVYGDFSYTLNLGGENKLALGLKAGATFHSAKLFSEVGNTSRMEPNDPAFGEDSNNTLFNFGLGALYYTDKFYVGVGVPNMLKGYYLNYDGKNYGQRELHGFLTAGYVVELDRDWKLKPSTMIKYAANSPISFDISANVMYANKIEAGVSYRNEDAIAGMLNYRVTPNLRVGYAYDYITSDINKAAKGSHEFMILYDIFFAKKVSSSSRYF